MTQNSLKQHERRALTLEQLDNTYQLAQDVINGLDDEALNELLGGYEGDIDVLFDSLLQESSKVLNFEQGKITTSSFGYLDHFTEAVEESFRINSLSYFIQSVIPDFEMNWHHLEWGNMVQMYRLLCIIAARDHCFAPGTKIRMFDGSLKKIENLQEGDLIMGPDSKSRTVLKTHSGQDQMYRIYQKKAMSYDVSGAHLLVYDKGGERIIESAEKYHKRSDYAKSLSYGIRSGFELSEKNDLHLDPYFLGLWLGDGTSINQNITTKDVEVIDYLQLYAERIGCRLSQPGVDCYKISRVNGTGKNNCLLDGLRSYNLLGNKHIPSVYLKQPRQKRLELLAGLIDSDGWLKDGAFCVTQKDEGLIDQIIELCNSLGFRAIKRSYNSYVKFLKRKYQSHQIHISGDIYEIPTLISRKQKKFKERRNNYQHSSIYKTESLGIGQYYGFECDGDHLFLLEDGTIAHNSKSFFFSKAYPLWKLYRYKKFDPLTDVSRERSLCEFGVLFTNEISLAEELLDKVKVEIEENDILKERLYPGKNVGWAKQSIRCKSGARMLVKSAGSKSRGLHPGWIVVDDYLNDQSLYSKSQRSKSIDHFHSVIMNMIVPNGQVCVVGTPFHQEDLYGDLKKNKDPDSPSRVWSVFEYPAIFPNGSLLWENRHSLEGLFEKRKSQGPLIFSREILVKPVTDDTAIFTKEILDKAFAGMDDYKLVSNRISFPQHIQFKRVVMGCDFARSANVGADYSCFMTLGVDSRDRLWVLNVFRRKGLTYHEQIREVKRLYANFRHDLIYMEDNQMQSLFVDGAKELGLPVEGHRTGANKKSLYEGLPALATLMEQGNIKFPKGDSKSKETMEQVAGELRSIAFIEDTGKLESTDQHDDSAMALWIASRAAHAANVTFNFSFI